ncbi:MAG: hypothetical protein IT208_12090 [Chthonomonadales bacterium]|nr:hypothetical protein [Chthonomonadales bacterium]
MPFKPRKFVAMTVTAALVACGSPTYGADTLWDLLRTDGQGDAEKGAAPTTPAQVARAAPPPAPLTAPDPVAKPAGHRSGGFLGFFSQIGHTLERLGHQTNSRIKVQGQHSLGFHMENVSGSRDSYDNSTYYGRRGLGGGYSNTDLTLNGKLFGVVNFETHYSNSLYGNPYDNRVSLNYATRGLKLDAGDIQGSLSGNSLIEFSRSLNGMQLTTDVLRGLKLTTLYSRTKAQTRTVLINGANRSGPYYVYAGQVVDGSERVRVNDRELVKGEDYTLDPFTGELNFLKGMIVHELDTIAVTFETYGYNQSSGLLTGWRADLNVLKGATFGLTYMTQTSSGGTKSRSKTEQFYGYNNAATPYTLDYPVAVTLVKDSQGKIIGATPTFPMTVLIGTLPQVYGNDYVVDPLLPNRVYFKLPIPSTQIIKIIYVPAYTNETPGNRSVWGLDSDISLGDLGTLTAEMASSRLDMSGVGVGGGAWQIRSDMRFLDERLHWNWNLRNIGADFTAVESPGFRRNERGFTTGIDYQANSRLKFSATLERTKRPSYDYSSLYGGTTGMARSRGLDNFNQMNLGANWQIGKAGTLNFTHNVMRTALGQGGRTEYRTNALTFSYVLGRVNLDMSVGQNHNLSETVSTIGTSTGSGTTPTVSRYGTDSFNSRLSLRWRAGERFSLEGMFANSTMKSLDGNSNTAQDIQLTANVVPLRNMRLTLGYQLQDSGGYSLFGTNGGLAGATGPTPLGVAASRQMPGAGGGLDYGSGGFYGGTGYNTGGGGLPYYGGGYNSGIGGFGNYSGGFYSGGYSNYGISSFGGNSRGFNVLLNYQPWPALTFDLNWSTSSSEGAYLYNSRRNDVAFNVSYSAGENLTLASTLSMQNVSYIGSTGGTSSKLLFLNARARPFGRLVTNLSFQTMQTSSTGNATDTGTGATNGTGTGGYGGGLSGGYGGGYPTYFGSGNTNLTSYGVRLEYPVWRGNNLFLQYDNADSTGYLASIQRTLTVGMAFPLSNNMQFTLGWRNQSFISRDYATSGNYNYSVRSLDADLGLRF